LKLRKLIALTIPHFVTEEVAFALCPDCPAMHPVCCMDDIEPGEVFDGIATVSCFSLFGRAFFSRVISDIRPWVNPHDAVMT
jgi:hypothetical protein